MKFNKILPTLLVAALVLTACGTSNETDIVEVDTNTLSAETIGELMSGDLLENPDVMCFYSAPVAESELEVTTYISGEKIRVEYMMVPPIQGQSDLYMVSDGEYGYVWGDSFLGGLMQGFKFPVSDTDTGDTDYEAEYEAGDFIDYETPLIDCTPWNVDNSYFTAPSDIEFTDMSVMEESMEAMAEEMLEDAGTSPGSLNVDCSMCDMLTGSDKEDCLDSLGC